MLEDLVKIRTVLKEKFRNNKLNQIDRVNLLEDTFQPITKPLKKIIGKFEDQNKDMYIDNTFDGDDDNDDVKKVVMKSSENLKMSIRI